MRESRMEVEVCLTTSSEAKLKGNHFTVRVHHWLIKLLASAMRFSLHSFVTTLSIKFVVAITRHSPPPPCCTGIFSRGNNHASHWHRGLQQAVYHSLTQHSAFDGSLDDRVERDRRLWKRISAAEFSHELSELDDIQTGVLINVDHVLEFHPSNYNCLDRECRKTVMALWEIHKTDYSKGYHIVVKLPVSHSYIEDSYEYTTYEGLKHLGAEDKHKEYTYRYTIGSDGRPSLKTDHRRVYKPIKFPVWNKNKNIYDLKKKEFHSIDGKNHDIYEEDERDDKVIRIEPRTRFHNRESLKPKKQGLVLAYVPGNSHREFQLPDHKYDSFIPIQHDSLKQVYNRDSYRHDSYEKEYDSRYLKGYEDAIRKYITEQRNKPKISPDFHPSKPYIQYSEPDPLYIQPSYISQSEEKINHDQSRFLVIQKYPESQVSVKTLAGITPTVPYISLTVSNKIPVQNINQFELPTTATTKTVTIPLTSSSSNQTVNITNNDVELITKLNNNPSLPLPSTITIPTKTTEQPQKAPATNAAIDTSREELTTTTLQPTTSASISNLDGSGEDSKLIFIKTSPNRNIIKKDTTSRISTINSNILSESSTQINTVIDNVTEVITPVTNITTEIQPQIATDSNKISDDTEKKSSNQSNLEETNKITTEDPKQIMLTQNLELLMTTTIKTTLATQLENEHTVISTTGINQADTLNTISTATVTTIPSTTTTATETTTNYLEEARNQLADLFASLTFDLFDEQPQFTSNSKNQQPINNTSSIQQNFSDILDNTNYDDFLNEEITESYKDVQHYVNDALIPINKQSDRNLTQLFSTRRHSNSH